MCVCEGVYISTENSMEGCVLGCKNWLPQLGEEKERQSQVNKKKRKKRTSLEIKVYAYDHIYAFTYNYICFGGLILLFFNFIGT